MSLRNTVTNSKQESGKENRRKHLIDATLRAIGKVGYANATLLHVAQEAGLSPSIVNFYFKTKEQLLLATLEQITLEYSTHWQAAVAKGRAIPAAGLDAIIDLDFQAEFCNPEKISIWLAFWSEAGNNKNYRDVVSKLEAGYTAETEILCARLIQEGSYESIDAKAVALGLNALIDGLWFDCLIDPAYFNREEAKSICRLYLHGLFSRHFPKPQEKENTFSRQAKTSNSQSDDKEGHLMRLASALRRRLEPIGHLRKEDLVTLLGISPKVLDTWMEGKAEPSSWQMGKLMALTDARFWMEVYTPAYRSLDARYQEKIKTIQEEIAKELSALSTLKG